VGDIWSDAQRKSLIRYYYDAPLNSVHLASPPWNFSRCCCPVAQCTHPQIPHRSCWEVRFRTLVAKRFFLTNIFMLYFTEDVDLVSAPQKRLQWRENSLLSESCHLRARSYPLLLMSISISSLLITRWLEVGSRTLIFPFSSILFYLMLVFQSFTSIESNRGAQQGLQGVWYPVPLGEYNQDSQHKLVHQRLRRIVRSFSCYQLERALITSCCLFRQEQTAMKQQLRRGGPETLNIYTVRYVHPSL